MDRDSELVVMLSDGRQVVTFQIAPVPSARGEVRDGRDDAVSTLLRRKAATSWFDKIHEWIALNQDDPRKKTIRAAVAVVPFPPRVPEPARTLEELLGSITPRPRAFNVWSDGSNTSSRASATVLSVDTQYDLRHGSGVAAEPSGDGS